MIRKVFREVGFRLLSAYAVMEEAYIEKLQKQGYIDNEHYHNARLETLQKVLVKLRNEGF